MTIIYSLKEHLVYFFFLITFYNLHLLFLFVLLPVYCLSTVEHQPYEDRSLVSYSLFALPCLELCLPHSRHSVICYMEKYTSEFLLFENFQE